MNQRLVRSVVQIIFAMSDEERQLLATEMQLVDNLSQDKTVAENESFRNGETMKGIQVSDESHRNSQHADKQQASVQTSKLLDGRCSENSFLRLAQSLQMEGPEDFSLNVDHYLYGLPKQDD